MKSTKLEVSLIKVEELMKQLSIQPSMPESDHLTDDVFIDYVLDRLTNEDLEKALAHLETCNACAEKMEQLLNRAKSWHGKNGEHRLNTFRDKLLQSLLKPTPSQNLCPHCGESHPANAMHCPVTGLPISMPMQNEQATPDLTYKISHKQGKKPPLARKNPWMPMMISLSLIFCIGVFATGVYSVFLLPERHEDARNQNATAIAQNIEIALSNTQTEVASRFTPTSRPTNIPSPSATITPLMGGGEAIATATSVEAVLGTRVAMVTSAAWTAEVIMQTTQTFPTALPSTGFADKLGMTELLALAVVFIVVIFLVRRLRASRT